MFLSNQNDDYGKPLELVDAETFNSEATARVERHMSYRADHAPTPLHSLPSLAYELDVGAVYVKAVLGIDPGAILARAASRAVKAQG